MPWDRSAGNTSKGLVECHFRCAQHQDFDPECPQCHFVQQLCGRFRWLSARRAQLVSELRQRLQRQEIIILEVR